MGIDDGMDATDRESERPPLYTGIFEHLEEHHTFVQPDTPLTRFYKDRIHNVQHPALDGPVAPVKVPFASPADAADAVEEMAVAAGADLVGFTAVRPSFVFGGAREDRENVPGLDPRHGWAAALGMGMDFDAVAKAPEPEAGVEFLRVYWRLGDVAVKVAAFIRAMGYSARSHHPRTVAGYPPTVLHTVAALEAGLGEVGRNGLLITPRFGPRVRLVTVTTELELPQARRLSFGVEEYCRDCTLCRDACEGGAIPDAPSSVRGYVKYTIDPYRCLPVFARTDGCGLCISKCAYNRREGEMNMMVSGK